MKSILIVLALLTSIPSFSQIRKILGRIVSSETKKPLRDVNVIIFGSDLGTYSNALGYFELNIDDSTDTNLLASHIGFKTLKLQIPTVEKFRFELEKEYVRLDDIYLNQLSRVPIPFSDPPAATEGHEIVEASAVFPGRINNFRIYLGNGLRTELNSAKEPLMIHFTINEFGKSSKIILSDSSEKYKSAVNRVFNQMPVWTPAIQRGHNVSQHFKISVGPYDKTNEALKPFYTYIGDNIKYPAAARRLQIEGTVDITFRIGADGRVNGVEILKDLKGGCGDEVKRIVLSIPKDLAKQLAVVSEFTYFSLPVSFGLG